MSWRRGWDSNPRGSRLVVFKTTALNRSATSPGIGRRDRNRTCNLRFWRPLLCLIELPAYRRSSYHTGYEDASCFPTIAAHAAGNRTPASADSSYLSTALCLSFPGLTRCPRRIRIRPAAALFIFARRAKINNMNTHLTQPAHCAFGSAVCSMSMVCRFSALRAEKRHTNHRRVPCCRRQKRVVVIRNDATA